MRTTPDGIQISAAPSSVILSDKDGLGYWVVPLAGFANPRYANASPTDATGFDISGCDQYVVAFENGATSTVVHEQTLDPTGLAGWFPVAVKGVNLPQSVPASAGSTNANAYIASAFGVRARVRVTALTVADLRVRVLEIMSAVPDVSTGAVAVSSGSSTAVMASAIAEDSVPTTTSAIGIALEARNTQKAVMSATGDVVRAQATMDGKQVVTPLAIPDLTFQMAGAAGGIVSSTADVVLKAALAGFRNYLDAIQIDHDVLGAVTEFVIKDGATIIYRGKLQTPATESRPPIIFSPPLRSSVNTALNFALLTSVTGGVFVNAQGHTGP